MSYFRKSELETLVVLPDHLKNTLLAMFSLGRASASMVSSHTRRARPIESHYLNQLHLLGYVKKEHIGRVVWFSLVKIEDPRTEAA